MNEFEIADWVRAQMGFEPWWPTVEPTARRVRVRLGGSTVADSTRAQLLIVYGRPPMLPTYYFPSEDIVDGVLSDRIEREDGSLAWTVRAAGREVADGAWTRPRPERSFPELDGMVTFDWRTEMEWIEEDERVFAHARDPHKRVDVLPSTRHVEVSVDGVVMAESRRPLLLFETTLPTRYYLPPADVRMDMLHETATVSQCPYKGTARYWSLGESTGDIAWSYPDPVPENPRIRDLVCFFNERVDLIVDGVPQARPSSPF